MAGTIERSVTGVDVDGRRATPWAAIGGAYLLIRLLIAVDLGPAAAPDTNGYEAVSLFGQATRLWTVPVLFAVTNDWGFLLVQTVVSAVAFTFAAWAIGQTFEHRTVRFVFVAVVLLVGASPRVTMWDATLLSESLAMSLTLVLIGFAVRFGRTPTWLFLAVFCAWVFLRDSHALIGVAVAAGFATAGWKAGRRSLVAGVCAIALWGLGASTFGDDWVETYNVTANVTHRIATDPDHRDWFVDHGMPDVEALDVQERWTRHQALRDDLEFQAWASTDGSSVYARWLLEHPVHTVSALRHLIVDDVLIPESMSDSTFGPYTDPPAAPLGALWPEEGSAHMLVLLLSACAATLFVVWSGRLDRRALVPLVLVLSCGPHALLVYHGAPVEVARHATTLSLVLVLSCAWLLALTADVTADRHNVGVSHDIST